MGKVSIVITNHNGKRFNEAIIKDILRQTYKNFEIIFVDNASTDNSVSIIKDIFKKEIIQWTIKIIENEKDESFTGANNIWHLNASEESEYICLLNNDTNVPNNRLEELINGIKCDKKLWAVWSIILDKWYEDIIMKLYTNWEVFISNLFGEGSSIKVSENEKKIGIYYTNFLSWTCLLYKKDIVDVPFPWCYKAYGEDTFLSWLITIRWHKMWVCTKSIVHHFWSSTFGKWVSSFKAFHGSKNKIINFLVFYDTWTKIKLLPLFLITQLWHLAINSPTKRLIGKFKARIWIIQNKKQIKELKKIVKNKRVLNDREFMKTLSHIFHDVVPWLNFSKKQIKIINKINEFFKFYCKHVLHK